MLPFGIENNMVVFSSGFTQQGFDEARTAVSQKCQAGFSWFPLLGNLGAAAVFMNIVAGFNYIRSGEAPVVECLDRDPYCRDSMVKLTKC